MSTAFTAPAFAQIETVVVTAQRKAEDLQSVPVAITAFTGEMRDKLGIQTIQDMANFTPGMTYSSSTDRVTVRGISRQTNVLSADSGVANYSDGIFQSFAVEAGRSALDIDRVEVLRGPQGTLYGRNSIGGAINQITPRPTDTPEAEFRADVGNYMYSDIEGMVGGPISDDWKARVYANWERQGLGYAKSIIPGAPEEGNVKNKWYIEGQIAGSIGSKLDVWVRAYSTAWNNGAGDAGAASDGWTPAGYPTYEYGQGALAINPGYGCTVLGATATSDTTVKSASSLLGANACVNPSLKTPWKIAKLEPTTTAVPAAYFGTTQLTYHTDQNFDIKYIGGVEWYRYVLTLPGESSGQYDAPISSFNLGTTYPQTGLYPVANPFPPPATIGIPFDYCTYNYGYPNTCPGLNVNPQKTVNYQQQEFFTQNELNFQSTGEGPFQWQGGVYTFIQHISQPVEESMPGQNQVGAPLYGPVDGPFTIPHAPIGNRLYDDRVQFNDESYAGYAQADYAFNDQFKLTGGVRYSFDHKYGTEASRLVAFGFSNAATGLSPEFLGAYYPAVDLTPPFIGYVDYSTWQGGTPSDPGIVAPATYDPTTGFANRKYDKSTSAVTGVVNLDWTPDETTLVYGKYSRGYKGGGFNTGIFSFINPQPFVGAEHVDAFEIGLKKSLGDWLVLDAAAYHYNYEDMQVPLTVPPATAGGISTVAFLSIPKSVSDGFEVESSIIPFEHLTVTTSYSYDDAHITSSLIPGLGGVMKGISDPDDPNALVPGAQPLYTAAQCSATPGLCTVDPYTIAPTPAAPGAQNAYNGTSCTNPTGCGWVIPQSLKGNALPNVPRNKIAVNVTYDWHIPDIGVLTPSVTYVWRGSQYGTIFTRFYNMAPSWDQWDARLSFASDNGHWNLIFYAKNIGNHIGYDTGGVGTRLAGAVDRSCTGAPLVGGGAIAGQGACNFVQGETAGAATAAPPGYGHVPGESAYGTVTSYSVNPPELFGVQLQLRI